MVFKKIQQEFGSFGNYLKSFTKDKVIYEMIKQVQYYLIPFQKT